MKKSTIYISANKTTATLVTVFSGGFTTRTKEQVYRIKGERWVTTLEDVIKFNPDADVVYK